MASRGASKVEVEITAVDDASPKIDKLQKKIDGLEADEARIKVSADITKLDAQLTDALAKLSQLEGDEYTVQARLVGTLEDDLIAARELFEKLDGQTGTVKLEANTADADAALRATSDETDRLTRSAGGANNALANMVGNSVQDIGELGGVVGSAGVAIGQMAEYASDAALDGERLGSALGSMAKVAGPIALLTVGVLGVKRAIEGLSEANELGATMQERWNKALDDGGDAAANWIEQMRETREIVVDMTDLDESLRDLSLRMKDFSWSRFFNPFESGRKQTEDITELFEKAGITIEQLGRAITGNEAVQARFRAGVEASTLSADEQTLVLSLLTQETERYTAAQEAASRFSDVFDPAPIKASAEAMAAAADQQERYVAGLIARGEEVAQQERLTTATTQHYEQLARVNTEAERVDRARIAERERTAVERVRDEYRKLRDDLADRRSLLQLQAQFDDLRDKAAAAWTAASEGADDAEQKQRDYQLAQIDTIDNALAYIETLDQLPDKVVTDIEALIDRGAYNEAANALEALSRPRSIELQVHLDELAIQRQIRRAYSNAGLPSGGPVMAPPTGGGPVVTPLASSTFVTVNMPRGSRGVDVIRQVTQQQRRSGRRYGVPVVTYARR